MNRSSTDGRSTDWQFKWADEQMRNDVTLLKHIYIPNKKITTITTFMVRILYVDIVVTVTSQFWSPLDVYGKIVE